MLTSELKGKELDFWVAKILKQDEAALLKIKSGLPSHLRFAPSVRWEHFGPFIDEHRISIRQVDDQDFKGRIIIASIEPQYPLKENVPLAIGAGWWSGDTALEAACRCFVASVYGNEVPD